MTKQHKIFTVAVMAIALLASPSRAEKPPVYIDLRSGDLPLISNTVIPIPGEVFAALDKMGECDWTQQLQKRDYKPNPDRAHSALLLGVAISQGFVAVQAKDAQEVLRIGQAVQKLAAPLGVGEAVEGRIKIIIESMNDGAWIDVKQEFDKTRKTVMETMQRFRDKDLATLVAVGGWLGGTEALAAMVAVDYSPERADLLNQTDLLGEIKGQYLELPQSTKSKADLFLKVEATLDRLEGLMKPLDDGDIALDSVTQIHEQSSSLVQYVLKN